MKKVVSVLVLMLSFGLVSCSLFHSDPETPPPPQKYQLQGVVRDGATGDKVRDALVTFDGLTKNTDKNGVYRFKNVLEGDNKPFRIVHESYDPYVTRINFRGNTQHNVRLVPDEDPLPPPPDWDFENTKLRGWSDMAMFYFYREKFILCCDEIAANGGNAIMMTPDRSWGYQPGDCEGERNIGWWRDVNENQGGIYIPQFGTNIYECVFKDSTTTINPAWVNRLVDYIGLAEDRGLWVLLTPFCPYDFKWFDNEWYNSDIPCGASPFTDKYASATAKHLSILDQCLPRLKQFDNLIICDNWEGTGAADGVRLAWKKKILNKVKQHLPDAPYFAFADNKHSNYAEVVQWINNEPRIDGFHNHYILGDTRSDHGLSSSKRFLNTEEHNLTITIVLPALRWADEVDGDVVMYASMRDAYREDDEAPWLKDGEKEEREEAYRHIRAYFGI